MSRPETDDSSNEGSGTDSEEDQKKMSSETSSGSESENESEANDSRFRVMKNSNEEKRPRDAVAAATALVDSANKRLKTLGGKPASTPAPDASQLKTPPANRGVASGAPPPKSGGGVKKPPSDAKKQAEPEKKKELEKEPTPKKTPQAWTIDDEHALILHIFKDMKAGLKPPKRGSRGENYHYWGDLHEQCQGKFSTAWTKEQLYDKYRRMKSRYDTMVEKERSEGVTALKFKSPGEEKIYNLWKQMYEMQEMEDPPPEAPKQAENSGKKPPAAASQRLEDEPGRSQRKTRSAAAPPPPPPPPAKKPDQEQPRSNGPGEERNSAAQELHKKLSSDRINFGELANGFGGSSGRLTGLNDWLMVSMRNSSPLLGMEMMVPSVFGAGASGLFAGVTDPKLKESLLKQQLEELRVMEQRFRLLQELCHYEQELLKQQQQQSR